MPPRQRHHVSSLGLGLGFAVALAGEWACAGEPAHLHHPLAATIQSPCDNQETFDAASRDRLNHLRRCGAIDDEEWSCLGSQLDFLDDDLGRRCEVAHISYASIAGEQRRRYATCILPFDPGLVACGLFTTDPECGEAFCDPERALPEVGAAPPARAERRR